MTRIQRYMVVCVCLLVCSGTAQAETVTLQWDRNTESDVVAYLVSYGTQPRALQAYPTTVDVGNQTQWSFSRSAQNQNTVFYFSVRAKNSAGLISPYSAEVSLETVGGLPAPAGSNDFNDDGRIDLLWRHQNNGLVVAWYMNGPSIGGAVTLGQSSDLNWRAVGTADFNRDGHGDILWMHQATAKLYLWYMNGTRIIGVAYFNMDAASDRNWDICSVADMNQDGWPDVIWQHAVTGQAIVWIMNGTTLSTWRPLTVGDVGDPRWRLAGVNDFNEDGRNDIVWQHDQSGEMVVWLMNQTTMTGVRTIFPSGSLSDNRWKIRSVADLNGDRMPDFVWVHGITGDVAVWLMNGPVVMRMFSVTQMSDLNWTLVGPR